MDRRQRKRILEVALVVAVIACFLGIGAFVQWWRCGEMFPHARFACFLGAR